jgi:hypothetical protein
MERRQFVKAFFCQLGLGLSLAGLAKTGFAKVIHQEVKTIKLSSGQIIIAEPGAVVFLPENPSNGDVVTIIVDPNSVLNPCKLQSIASSIGGDQNHLILDTIANFRLQFLSSKNDWVLS